MSSFSTQQLLADLEATVRNGMQEAEQLQTYQDEQLRERPANGGWSVVEVLNHLNYYANYYTQALAEAMEKNGKKQHETHFKSGWLGNYFTNIIGPPDENGQLKMKMQSPPDAVPPSASDLNPQAELETYLAHQRKLLQLLHQARSQNLGSIRVPITISRWIRLKLGDTLRFVVAHQQRHHQQIAQIIS